MKQASLMASLFSVPSRRIQGNLMKTLVVKKVAIGKTYVTGHWNANMYLVTVSTLTIMNDL